MRLFNLFLVCSMFIALNSDTTEIKQSHLTQKSTLQNADCIQDLSGLILDKVTKKPISNALVSLFLDDKEISFIKTNSSGAYTFKLNCNSNYKITVKAKSYFDLIHKFKTGTTSNNFTLNFALNKQCYQTVSGVLKNGISNDLVYNATVTLNKDGEEIGKLKAIDGKYSFNVECGENYSLKTSSPNYINNSHEFSTTNNSVDIGKYDFHLEPECIQTISGTIKDKTSKEPISATLKLYINNIETQTLKINNDGKYIVEFPCTTNYKIIASRHNYHEDSYNFLTDYRENKQSDYFHIKKDLYLESNECIQLVSGTVLNKDENKIIPNALVTLIYQNQEVKSFQTNEDANFFFYVNCGEKYEIKTEKSEMVSSTIKYLAGNVKNEKVIKNIYLEPIPCKQVIEGLVIDKITKLPIANSQVAILENNSEISKKVTDAHGKFFFVISCEKQYKIVASNSNFNSEFVEFGTSKDRDITTNKTLELQPLDCKQMVNGLVIDKTTKLPIANSSVSILENNSEISKKITDAQGKFSFDVSCEKQYKIVASNSNFNSEFVEFGTSKDRDITTNKTLELQPLDCKQVINGLVIDKTTKLPIANSSVSILENNSEISKKITDAQGKFSFNVSCEKQYRIVASNSNFNSEFVEFGTSKDRDITTNKTLELQPLDCKQVINGLVIDKTTKLPIANSSVSILENNSEISKKITDAQGKFSFNISCEKQYKIVASNSNFNSEFVEFETSKDRDITTNKTLELQPLDCKQVINGLVIDKTTKLPIANSSVSILENNSEISKKVTDAQGKFSFNISCEKQYRIVASNSNFNSEFVEFGTSKDRDITTNKTLELQPLDCKQVINGLVIDKTTKLPIANSSVSILENNSEISKKVTDAQGKFSFDISCEKQYRIVASNSNFNSEFVEFGTSKDRDITTNKTLELQPLDCKQVVNGLVIDKTTKLPIANSQVAILENNSEISKKITDAQGKFSFDISCEKQYKIVASNSNFNSEFVEFGTSKDRDITTNKTLELQPLDCKQMVNGLVIDKTTKLPIANSSVSILENNSEISKKITDAQGKFSFNVSCEKQYKIVASNSNFNSESVEFGTSKDRDITTNKTLELQPLDCKQAVNGLVINKTTKLPIANSQVAILENNSEISKKITDAQGKFSFNVSCEKQYKIVASNSNFNSEFVEFGTSKDRDITTNKTLELQEKESGCNQTVTGIIRDKISKRPLPNSTVNLYQENELISSFTVGENGIYEFPLKCETDYRITVYKYNSLEAFRLKTAVEHGRSLTLHFDIEPLVCTQYIYGTVKESISENVMPNTPVTLFNNSKEIAKTQTDNDGTFYFSIECSKSYTIVAQKENYTKTNTQIFSSSKTGAANNLDLTIEPIIPFTEKNGIRYIETEPLVFALNEFEINNEVKVELNKVVYNMNQNPAIKIEVNYHTDSRGPDDYNLQLTKNRANSTKEYLISKGISPSRIEAYGYGETQLLNNCSNNVKCSEEEHSINRRTEFKVINK